MAETSLGEVQATPDGRYEVRFERDFCHSAEAVWQAVSSTERIGHWLADAEVELRPHGRFRLSGQCNVEGEVLEVTPPVVFKWTWPHPEHPRSEVRINISRLQGEACHMTIVQTDLPRRHLLDVVAGWHTHLDALPRAILDVRTPFDSDRAAAHYRRYAAALGA